MRATLLRNRFVRNWSFLVGSNLVCQILGMFATIRIARVLSPAGYGHYNLVQVVAGVGVVLAGMGLRHVIIREVARHPEHSSRLFSVAALVRFIVWIIIAIGVAAYILWFQASLGPGYITVVVGLMIGLSSLDLIETIAFGHERMEFSAGIALAASTVWAATAWLVPPTWMTPLTVSIAFALLQLVQVPFYLVAVLRARLLQIRIGFEPVGRLVREGLPFYWLALLTLATSQIPILFLAARSDPSEVGLFNIGYRLTSPMLMFIATALTALYPGLAQVGLSDPARFRRMIEQAVLFVVVFGTVCAIGVSLLRQEVVLLLFGRAYRASADAMVFQAWYMVLFSLLSLIGTALAARDAQRLLALLASVNTLLSIGILWVGASYGATGLAASLCMAAGLALTYHWVVFQRVLGSALEPGLTLKGLAMLGGGMLISWLFPAHSPLLARLVLAIGVGGLVGAAGLRRMQARAQLRLIEARWTQ